MSKTALNPLHHAVAAIRKANAVIYRSTPTEINTNQLPYVLNMKVEQIVIPGVKFWNGYDYIHDHSDKYQEIKKHCFSLKHGEFLYMDMDGNGVFSNDISSRLSSFVSHGCDVLGCTESAIYFHSDIWDNKNIVGRLSLLKPQDLGDKPRIEYFNLNDAPDGLMNFN